MIIGVMSAHLAMPGIGSLKEKRSIVKGVIGRLQSRFNVSVSEVDHQDTRQMAVLGMAVVSNDSRFVEEQLDTILNFMQNDGRFFISHVDRETFGA
jgi:uncharacterized protein